MTRPSRPSPRDAAMLRLARDGATLAAIGAQFGLTKAGVAWVLAKHGHYGGGYVGRSKAQQAARKAQDAGKGRA